MMIGFGVDDIVKLVHEIMIYILNIKKTYTHHTERMSVMHI